MQISYVVIICDSKTGKNVVVSVVCEEYMTPDMAVAALDRAARYHELGYGVDMRGEKEKFSGKVAVTLKPKKWLKELPEILLDAVKSVARALGAELRETDEKLLSRFKAAVALTA